MSRKTLKPTDRRLFEYILENTGGAGNWGHYRYGLISSEWNPEITERLVNGVFDFFSEINIDKDRVSYLKVPGSFELVNGCVQMDVDGTDVLATREIDGGSESLQTNLPLVVGGQKGIVEESDLRIPNMRGIMMARKKPLSVLESTNSDNATNSVSFEKPAPKGAVKLVDAENIDELINLLHNEAKVI